MARALGPTCTPRPLGQPGLTCPQAPAQRSRDKYTRTPCVPADRFARQAPVGTALRGRLPAPPRPLGDSLQPRRAPHTASRGPSPGRRRPPDPPGPPRAPRPRGASPRRDSTPSSELSPECRVPSPAPERAGVGSPGRGGRPRGAARARGRAGPARSPGAVGALAVPAWTVGTRAIRSGSAVRSTPGRARPRGMKGARPRPRPGPRPPIPAARRKRGGPAGRRGPRAGGAVGPGGLARLRGSAGACGEGFRQNGLSAGSLRVPFSPRARPWAPGAGEGCFERGALRVRQGRWGSLQKSCLHPRHSEEIHAGTQGGAVGTGGERAWLMLNFAPHFLISKEVGDSCVPQ